MSIHYDDTIFKEIKILKAEAIAKTGFDDFGDPFFENSIAAWIHDLRNPILSDFGRQLLRRVVLRELRRRLKVLACLTECPEILEVKIPSIILIIGPPRTGTTLLHNLMATHPLGRPLLHWELTEPIPPPMFETYATDPRISKVQASIEPLRGSLLERVHWINADEPDENPWGFIDCTGMLNRGILSIMPTWRRWVQDHDHRSTFRDFRKLVQLLIWKCPPPKGGHLVLKCAVTSQNIQAFADVFPEATFILTHRDPYRALVSSCATGEIVNQPFIKEELNSLHEDGKNEKIVFNWQKMMFSALVEFARNEPVRVKSIQYADLMSNAGLTIHSAYSKIGINAPENLEQRIVYYLNQQRSGMRATPLKKYETFGYNADVVWDDPIVTEYCKFFGVQRERVRLIDTKTGT